MRRASAGARVVPTLASLVALCLAISLPARAESDGGVVLDAPRVLKLTNGHYDFNPAAFTKVDDELKRLQQVERIHKQEPSHAAPVLIGLGVGLLTGAALGVAIGAVLWK